MSANMSRPRRSMLYMPGSNPKALEKAKTLGADCLVFDLEDAIAPESKNDARDLIKATMENGGYGKREIIIRANGLNTPWLNDDLKMIAKSNADGVLIPKISHISELKQIHSILEENGAKDLPIWAMIETPMAIINLPKICSAKTILPFCGIVMGTNDLAKETGATLDLGRAPFIYALSAAVTSASAYGIVAIDGVFNDINDLDGLKTQSIQAKDFGFNGKTIIHPTQIDTANEIFAPSEAEIANARAIVDAFNLPENANLGVIKVNGKMSEILHRDMALKTLAIANAIESMK